jgi:hypothetical protein
MSVVRKHPAFGVDVNEDESEEMEEQSSQYEFPAADAELDSKHLSRLDEDTKLRRRVYEMLLANSCGGLEVLDGLVLDRAETARRDAVWRRLVELGIIRRSQGSLLED